MTCPTCKGYGEVMNGYGFRGQEWWIKCPTCQGDCEVPDPPAPEHSTDPNKALRLARREDAEALSTIVEDCEKIAEHGWPGDSPSDAEQLRQLRKAAEQFVNAYQGKEHQLGNGQALRSFLRFRELLNPQQQEETR